MYSIYSYLKIKNIFSRKFYWEGLITMIMHNLCVFCTFFTPLLKTPFKGRGCNFTWSFGKVICSKLSKMAFVARIIRHKSCILYAFVDFFVQKIIFDQNLSSYCWDKFDYQGSIVYLSCWLFKFDIPNTNFTIWGYSKPL